MQDESVEDAVEALLEALMSQIDDIFQETCAQLREDPALLETEEKNFQLDNLSEEERRVRIVALSLTLNSNLTPPDSGADWN